MFRQDPFARHLGIELVALDDGYARTALVVRPEHLNYQGAGHGGLIFSLADTAFGAASNSHGRVAVGLVVTIHYIAPVAVGDRLEAEARLEHLGGRTGLYHIEVRSATGTLVASAQGMVYRRNEENLAADGG